MTSYYTCHHCADTVPDSEVDWDCPTDESDSVEARCPSCRLFGMDEIADVTPCENCNELTTDSEIISGDTGWMCVSCSDLFRL